MAPANGASVSREGLHQMLSRITTIIVAAAIAAGALAFADGDTGESIRVGLHYGSTAPGSVVISGTGAGQGERSKGTFEGDVEVTAAGDTLVLEHNDQQVRIGRWVEFWPTGDEQWLDLDDATYRGKLRIELEARDRLKVINIVGIEEYVRGVVPNEMFADGAACEVQAVISRTFAIYVRDVERKHRRDGFDICTTGHCQVYRGLDSERPLSDKGVEATRGEILTYRGNPILAAYHANAGGQTQTVDEAWPGSVRANFPYLSSVESPYDATAGTLNGYNWCYRWQRVVAREEIGERLRRWGNDVGEVRDLVVKATTSSGRVKEMEVVGSRRNVRLRRPEEVRSALQAPSCRFELKKVSAGFELTGWGRGHGVGLSQHGALGMSKAGYTYDQILGHYYRGVSLEKDYGRGESRSLTPPEIKLESAVATPVVVPPGMS